MDEIKHQLIRSEALRIGKQLISLAQESENTISWKTVSIDDDLNVTWIELETIYNGVSGIVLFFIQLFEFTKNEEYLDVAKKGMSWVENYCRSNDSTNYAFYTGRIGVSYAMLKLFDVTGQHQYLEKALNNARSCERFFKSSQSADLLSGISGMALGLLHLYAASKETWILERINLSVELLIKDAHHGPVGLYWDRFADHARGLCGVAHGAAGVGFVLAELGHYLQEDSLVWIAEQAYLYENHYFDQIILNWPDFRKNILDKNEYEKYEKAFVEGRIELFTEGQDFNAWCHGAAGIGLTRIRVLDILKKRVYKRDVENAIKKTYQNDIISYDPEKWKTYTLCHGKGGRAELFISAFQHFRNKLYMLYAESIAMQALKMKEHHGVYFPGYVFAHKQEDTSLFMGNAGIGYFYLRLLNPDLTPSILMPVVAVRKENGDDIVKANIPLSDTRKNVVSNVFKRTIHLLSFLLPEEISNYFDHRVPKSGVSEKNCFLKYAKVIIGKLPESERKRVDEVLKLELRSDHMKDSVPSNTLLHVEKMSRRKQTFSKIDCPELTHSNILINPRVVILQTNWNWSSSSPEDWINNLNINDGRYYVLLMPLVEGVVEEVLTPFSYIIFSELRKGKTVGEIIQSLISDLRAVSGNDIDTITQVTIQQVQQGLKTGILVHG